MKCEECGDKLEVVRRCRRIRLTCRGCQREYQIHEVATRLDSEMEEQLSQYTTLIYD